MMGGVHFYSAYFAPEVIPTGIVASRVMDGMVILPGDCLFQPLTLSRVCHRTPDEYHGINRVHQRSQGINDNRLDGRLVGGDELIASPLDIQLAQVAAYQEDFAPNQFIDPCMEVCEALIQPSLPTGGVVRTAIVEVDNRGTNADG
jgi:hypothetical protein